MRLAITGFAALVLAIPSAAAWARGVEAIEDQAHAACLAGQTDLGVRILAELYVSTREPNYIYNQGRCFEQNSRPAEAISRFREYLRTAGRLTVAERADAEQHIRDCEAQLAPAPPPPPSPKTHTPPSDRGPAPRRSALAGVLVGAGALALVAGAASGLEARTLQSDVEDQWNRSQDRWGRRLTTLQWVAYALGGLSLATGAVLWFAPATNGQGATLAVRGTF